jgi:hypothetical protein
MKTKLSLLTIVVPTLILAACGDYQKNPVSNLDEIRENGKTELELGPDKPREVTKYVIQDNIKTVEQASISDNFVVITAEGANTTPYFYEGQAKALTFRLRPLTNKIQAKLTAEGLPAGATFTASAQDKDLYVLAWTPALYTVPASAPMKDIKVKLVAQLVSAETKDLEKKFKSVSNFENIVLFLFKNQVAMPTHSVSGLPTEINEGDIVTFKVTAVVPGVDDKSAAKPTLEAYYDKKNITGTNSFQELDGYKYLDVKNVPEAKYLGGSTWEFTRTFNTKDVAVDPQLAKDGSVMKEADGTRVRVSFKVKSPNYGFTSNESTSLIKIKYNKPATAPRFDLVGLGQPKLEVSPGQKVTVKFAVSSSEKGAVVAISTKQSTLAGNPEVNCKDSSVGASKQDCAMTWNVPCDAAQDQLTGKIEMSAVATLNGLASEPTQYELSVQVAKVDKKLCAAKQEKK